MSTPGRADETPGTDEAAPRRVLSLASAALVVLVAEPLYLLVDTAVVGHLGAVPLAGLAVGAAVIVLAGNGLSAVVCPALVYGWGPVPALGLVGSGSCARWSGSCR